MGNTCIPIGTPESREKAKRSHQVDNFLQKHGKQMKDEIKLLLLGIIFLHKLKMLA